MEDEKESEEVGKSNGQDVIRCRSSILPTPAHVVLPRSVRGPVYETPETLAVIERWAGRAATRSDWHATRARGSDDRHMNLVHHSLSALSRLD